MTLILQELCDTLIGICTDIGDIEGAVTVLTHAKEANLPLTPSMLSTMMQGYILNGYYIITEKIIYGYPYVHQYSSVDLNIDIVARNSPKTLTKYFYKV